MSSYRPKSLNELNNLYGKSVEAENAIKKSTTKIEKETTVQQSGFVPEDKQSVPSKGAAASDELMNMVEDFSRRFGAQDEPKSAPVQPVPVQSRPRPVRGATQVRPLASKNFELDGKPRKPEVIKVKDESKSKLIRNAERSDLFENYKNIMDDDDENERKSHLGQKRRQKRAAVAEAQADEAAAVNEAPEQQEALQQPYDEAYNIPEDAEDIAQQYISENRQEPYEEPCQQDDSSDYYGEEVYEDEQQYEQYAEEYPQDEEAYADEQYVEEYPEEEYYDEQYAEQEYSDEYEAYPDEDVQPEKPVKAEKSKGAAAQTAVMAILFVVLILSILTASVQTVLGVNTGRNLFGLRFYTVSESYTDVPVENGQFVVTKEKEIFPEDVFVYENREGSYTFAVCQSRLNEESVVALSGGEKAVAFDGDLRGTVLFAVPVLGIIISLISSNFVPVIGVLLFAVFALVLVLAFAFKDKSAYSKKNNFEDDDDKGVFSLIEGE